MFKLRNKVKQWPRIGWFVARLMLDRVRQRRDSGPGKEGAVLEYVRQYATQGDPDSVLRAMDEFARERDWLMNVGPEKGDILRRALIDSQARDALEIGAYCGYSAVLIGQALSNTGGKLISIEKSGCYADVARQIVAHAGVGGHVDMRVGVLTDFIDQLQGKFDLVFLDHWKDLYLPDLKRLEKAGLLRDDAVVVADNIEFFDVPDYLTHVRDSGRYRSTFYKANVEYQPGIDDGVEVSVYTADG